MEVLYQLVYIDGGLSRPYDWRMLLLVIASRRHYGLSMPVVAERVCA